MVNKPLSNVMPTYGNKTLEFVKGKGCYLYTSQNKKYLDFVLLLMLSTGLAFQLPILQLILGFFEIISWEKMLSAWRLVVMASAIAGAVLTPSTDPITMLLLSASITFLFFVGIGLVALTTNLKGQFRPSFDP